MKTRFDLWRHPFSRIHPLLAILGLAALVSCGQEATPGATTRSMSKPIVNGTIAGNAFGNAPAFVVQYVEGGRWDWWGTGIVVDDRVVLTAGHSVVGSRNAGAVAFGVTFSQKFDPCDSNLICFLVEGEPVMTGVPTVHPDFPTDFTFPPDPDNNADIAVVVLDRPVGRHIAAARLPRAGKLDGLMHHNHPTVGFVGIGLTETFDSAGVRHYGSAVVDQVFTDMITSIPDPSAICGGDSGGPGWILDSPRRPIHAEKWVKNVDMLNNWADCFTFGTHVRLDTAKARGFIGRFVDLRTHCE